MTDHRDFGFGAVEIWTAPLLLQLLVANLQLSSERVLRRYGNVASCALFLFFFCIYFLSLTHRPRDPGWTLKGTE